MAALGLVVDETVLAPAAVVEAAAPVDEPDGAEVVPVPVPEGAELEEAQVTAEGTVTPWAAQNFEAYSTAEAWSEALQAPTRQQAMPLRKFLSAQMQAALMEEQLPMLPPVVNFVRQAVCERRKASAWSRGYSRVTRIMDSRRKWAGNPAPGRERHRRGWRRRRRPSC